MRDNSTRLRPMPPFLSFHKLARFRAKLGVPPGCRQRDGSNGVPPLMLWAYAQNTGRQLGRVTLGNGEEDYILNGPIFWFGASSCSSAMQASQTRPSSPYCYRRRSIRAQTPFVVYQLDLDEGLPVWSLAARRRTVLACPPLTSARVSILPIVC